MAQLVSVLKSATTLSAALFDRAEDPAFEDKERAAFRADALMVVSATQALSISPAAGYDSGSYDPAQTELGEAIAATSVAAPGDGGSIHQARLEVVQAVEAMKAITARPAIAVS